ncbi:glycerol kinase GlpK [Lacinutrix sp. Hel_I_90]|uniref:glycerol kinase GlpK n=1 Tax=Lacinutrix sp. Hel_I_90 TaxID=1249999 RepID=UPI000A3FE6E1|nr:glycerol kinase GlpK [Lacinutrix sp. Hel_I_90]
MIKDQFILALDQGTTASRAILFNRKGEMIAVAHQDFEQILPQSGWVEHNANTLWESQLHTIKSVLKKAKITSKAIAAIGITNQRETTVLWDRTTGEPIYNAIVWQDRRTAQYCNSLKEKGHSETIKQKTGLLIDSYFSATKIKWILDNVKGARIKAKAGTLCFGTIDSWLVYKLTNGKKHITDVSNASRTLLFNIHRLEWDDALLELLDIPKSILPEVCESSMVYAETAIAIFDKPVKIAGIAGDQQAALFGQLCTKKGMAKNTYGTGCFLLMNTGETPIVSKNNLLTTIAWQINGKVHYAIEGSVFVGGAAVQWLRDGLKLIAASKSIETLAGTLEDNEGVYFVPALTGLGAPHWDPYARGAIFGISRGTTQAHIARATLEGIAYQVYDIVRAMEEDAHEKCTELRVDGGASANNLLLQFQSDIFGFEVIRPKMLETTALGAAYLAGLAVGYWESLDALQAQWSIDRVFKAEMPQNEADQKIKKWHEAVKRTRGWAASE